MVIKFLENAGKGLSLWVALFSFAFVFGLLHNGLQGVRPQDLKTIFLGGIVAVIIANGVLIAGIKLWRTLGGQQSNRRKAHKG